MWSIKDLLENNSHCIKYRNFYSKKLGEIFGILRTYREVSLLKAAEFFQQINTN